MGVDSNDVEASEVFEVSEVSEVSCLVVSASAGVPLWVRLLLRCVKGGRCQRTPPVPS